ncbi:MAG TPA: hypothetical protein VF796_12060, partial [Humisphaera sp.]
GGGTQVVVVTYVDDDLLNPDSIDATDVVVAGPAGPLAVTGVTVAGAGNVYTATYTVAAPGGSWDAADAGAYSVAVQAGAVTDAAGTGVAPAAGGFAVTIAPDQPTVDPTFGGGQTVSGGFVAEAGATLEDGRLLLAGRQGNVAASTSQGVLKMLRPDGTVDTSWAKGGAVVTEAGGNVAYYAIAVLPDGGFVAAGSVGGDMVVARYKANGSLDAKFGTGGRAAVNAGAADDAAYSVAVGPDGSVYLGGTSNGALAFAKVTPAGVPDAFFGTNGVSLFTLGTGANAVGAVQLQPDGKLLGVGSAGADVAVVRLNADGSQDLDFGTGGAVTVAGINARTDLGDADRTLGVAIDPNGRILLTNRAGGDFAVARLNADGSPDSSFGSGGTATVDFGGDDDADAIVLQSTGEILLVGTTTAGGGQTAVAALHTDGTLDDRFGTGGKFTIAPGVTDPGRALHIGDLVLRAFAAVGAGGNGLVVGTSSGAANAVASSGLQRLNVPGSGLLGRFGVGAVPGGKSRKLKFVDADGTTVTVSVKGGGSGQAFYDGSNVDVVLTGTTPKTSVSVKTSRAGDGRLTLRNVRADGPLKAFSAKTADLSGTFWAGGDVGSVTFGSVTGTVAASGSIGTFATNGDVNGAEILAGANLGNDFKLGGTAQAADAYAAASIRKISVKGAVTGSIFGAGLNRVNNVFLDNDDVVEGGAASQILSISAKRGVDTGSRFVAGSFGGTAKIPQRVLTSPTDPRFVLL